MEKSVDNKPTADTGRTEPDLYDYKQMVLEKEKFQKILENKVRELDRSNKELEEFAYIASHDFNGENTISDFAVIIIVFEASSGIISSQRNGSVQCFNTIVPVARFRFLLFAALRCW